MKTTDLIYDTIRHEANEATKNSQEMRFGVDWSSYWYNRDKYFECMQKIGEENMQIFNINEQAKSRGYYTDYEQKELMMHKNARNEHIGEAINHYNSASEDAKGMCRRIMDEMYRRLQYQYAYWNLMRSISII